MTEAEYLARLAERATDWRTKYPSRADELRPVMRRHLGITLRQSQESDFARRSLEQGENEMIRIFNGWPSPDKLVDEPPPPTASTAKAEVIKALDLEEIPTSGRDRAAGVERE